MVGLASPATAQSAHQSVRQEINRVISAYLADFSKHDAAAIATLYTKDTVRVTPLGVSTGRHEVQERYQQLFKLGFNHDSVSLDKLLPVRRDAVIVIGEYHTTGKGKNGVLRANGHYAAVFVRRGRAWKVLPESVVPNAPKTSGTPKAASSPKR